MMLTKEQRVAEILRFEYGYHSDAMFVARKIITALTANTAEDEKPTAYAIPESLENQIALRKIEEAYDALITKGYRQPIAISEIEDWLQQEDK